MAIGKKERKTAKASPKTSGALEKRVKRLEAQLREYQDEREIRELLARYALLADQALDEAFVQLFTEDGEVSMEFPASYAGEVRWKGRERLRQFISGSGPERRPGAMDPHEAKREGRFMHVQSINLRTYIDGDEATAENYNLFLTKKLSGEIDVHAGSCRWAFRRIKGRWYVKQRIGRPMGLPSFQEPFLTKS